MTHRRDRRRTHVLLVIENVAFARDHRARKQADALARAGQRVTVLTQRDPENARFASTLVRLLEYRAPREASGAVGYVLEYAWSLAAWLWLAVRQYVREPFGVIQAGQPPDVSPALALPFRWLGVRYVVDQRDLSPELFVTRFGGRAGPLPGFLRLLERTSWRLADRVLCVNDSLRDAIVGRGGVDPAKVTIVANGPVLARVAEARPDPALREGAAHLVCWVGVMGQQDRLDLSLRAAAEVVHRLGRRDVRFVFIGDGESLSDAKSLAGRLGIEERVAFPGWLDEAACFAYLATADVGIDTNLQEEVSPVKGMEYLAFGLPFVAFDLPQTRAMAGDAGSYVPRGDTSAFADEIGRLLEDRARAERMGRAGMDRVLRVLAWERQEERYVDVYRSLRSEAPKRVPRAARDSALRVPTSQG
jgi:glycosyltransferase involved in cell wall biosynthesis